MTTRTTTESTDARSLFDAYCSRHSLSPDTAVAELVHLALGLPADILDYLREQKAAAAA